MFSYRVLYSDQGCVDDNLVSVNSVNTKEMVVSDKPVLFVSPGMSNNSYVNTLEIIEQNLPVIVESGKFSMVLIFDFDEFKNIQVSVFKKVLFDKINYQGAHVLNNKIAETMNNLIIKLKFTNVHLLGKCNGAWISTLLLLKNVNCKALYLSVPGIPPSIPYYKYYGLERLAWLPSERLAEIRFMFSWNTQDEYEFHWKVRSIKEKSRYDEFMSTLPSYVDYRSFEFNYIGQKSGGPTCKKHHEIHPDFLKEICQV
jgi:hypothetical protein